MNCLKPPLLRIVNHGTWKQAVASVLIFDEHLRVPVDHLSIIMQSRANQKQQRIVDSQMGNVGMVISAWDFGASTLVGRPFLFLRSVLPIAPQLPISDLRNSPRKRGDNNTCPVQNGFVARAKLHGYQINS
jgi:hypothetical protein